MTAVCLSMRHEKLQMKTQSKPCHYCTIGSLRCAVLRDYMYASHDSRSHAGSDTDNTAKAVSIIDHKDKSGELTVVQQA